MNGSLRAVSAAVPAALSLLASACGDATASGTAGASVRLDVRLEVDAANVEFGAPFALRVVRVWTDDLVVEPFAASSLAPLVVAIEATTRREVAGDVEETVRCRARTFALGAVAVPAPEIAARPRAGGPVVRARGNGLDLVVASSLPDTASGPDLAIEGPGGLLDPPAGRWWWPWALGLAAIAAVATGFRLRRSTTGDVAPARAAVPTAPPPGPAQRALQRLDELEAEVGAASALPFCTGLSAVLRDFTGEVVPLGAPGAMRTAEEVVAAVIARGAEKVAAAAALRACLQSCDLVKFAARRVDAAVRTELLVGARAFVRAMDA